MTATRYRHTQIGYVLIAGLAAGMLVLVLLLIFIEFNWISFAVIFPLLLALGLFPTLTVELLDERLYLYYGLGFIWKNFPLREITSCRALRIPWYYGWGLKWTPGGWMYRVSGLSVVEVEMEGGRKYRIGSDEPEELVNAIKSACGVMT